MDAALLDGAAAIPATFIRFSLYFSLLCGNSCQRPVRVRLRQPPRSPIQTEISWCRANSAEYLGFRAGLLSLLTIG
jgi:hypothetical protein